MSKHSHSDEKAEKKAKPLSGVVTSDRMNKSRVCTITRKVKHAEYNKYVTRRTKIMFHDPSNESKMGDKVLITAARPRSSRKKFDLLKVVEKAKEA